MFKLLKPFYRINVGQARGKVSCATCEGTTSILCFIQLSISWKINTSEHITDKLDIPEDLIRDVR